MGPGDEVNRATAAQDSNTGLRDFFILAEIMRGAEVHLS
jgi:hypothetical protein